MLHLDGIVGIGSLGVGTRPSRPVGTVVHLGNPDRATAAALADALQLALPSRFVLEPVGMHGDEVAAPSTGIDGINELIEPVVVACHGWRTQSASGGHHLRPVGKHVLYIHILLLVVGLVFRLVVAQNVGTACVVAHIGYAWPSLVVVLGYVFTVCPVVVVAGIPVVAP